MKISNIASSFLLTFICIASVSCKESVQQSDNRFEGVPSVISSPTQEWVQNSYTSSWFSIDLRTLTQDSAQAQQRNLSNGQLVELEPRDFKGYRLFEVLHSLEEKRIEIVPKLLVQSEIFGGRIRFLEGRPGGLSAVRFNVALIDGQSEFVSSGYSRLLLPKGYPRFSMDKVKDHAASESGIMTSNCPERMELRQGSDSLVIYPTFGEEGCPRNQFFLVTAAGETSELRNWFEDRIPKGNVSLWVEFRPKASFVKQTVVLDINANLFYEKLYSEFIESENVDTSPNIKSLAFNELKVHEGLKRIVNQSTKASGFSGLLENEQAIVFDAVISSFFEATGVSCGTDSGVCFRFKSRDSIIDSKFHFTFQRSQDVHLSGQAIESSTPISDLAQDVELFRIEAEQTNDNFPPETGRVGGLLRQVSSEDLVELEISQITGVHRNLDIARFNESRSKLQNPECVSYGDVPTREETDPNSCLEWNQGCAQWKDVCRREAKRCLTWNRICLVGGGGTRPVYSNDPNNGYYECERILSPARCSKDEPYCAELGQDCVRSVPTSCKTFGKRQVPSGPAPCLKTENHWMKYFDLGDPVALTKKEEDLATFEVSELLSRIDIQFSSFEWKDSNHFDFVKVSCPISSFYPEVKATKNSILLRFRVKNHEESRCIPFNVTNSSPGYLPEISIVNRLTFPEKALCGFVEEFWDGKQNYTCPKLNKSSKDRIYDSYFPRMEIQGKLKLPGLRFKSSETEEK